MNVPDYKRVDYRGFVFAIHEAHGLLLLHCTRKPKKGPHYQLPGGHVDDYEFEKIGRYRWT
jgi:8-oxo-dGTP pyrophosphatase MutT (NUDIX family)